DVMQYLMRNKADLNPNTLNRILIEGAEALIKAKDYFRQTTVKIINTREWDSEQMKEHGFHVIPSKANFIFVSHARIPAKTLYENLKEIRVLVRQFDKQQIDKYIRITIGNDEAK